MPAGPPLTGIERLRRDTYDRLLTIGAAALPALCRGLGDPDVQIRRNVALFLGAAAGGWYGTEGHVRLTINECVPALIKALADADSRVRELSAQAIGSTGAAGAPAVPALIELLHSRNEGERNSACIGLAGIGPAAKAALPALQKALADSSATVRTFAQRAIERIDR